MRTVPLFWKLFIATQLLGVIVMIVGGISHIEHTAFVVTWAVLLFPGEFVWPFLRFFFRDTSDSILISADLVLIVVVNAAFWFVAKAVLHLFSKAIKGRG